MAFLARPVSAEVVAAVRLDKSYNEGEAVDRSEASLTANKLRSVTLGPIGQLKRAFYAIATTCCVDPKKADMSIIHSAIAHMSPKDVKAAKAQMMAARSQAAAVGMEHQTARTLTRSVDGRVSLLAGLLAERKKGE